MSDKKFRLATKKPVTIQYIETPNIGDDNYDVEMEQVRRALSSVIKEATSPDHLTANTFSVDKSFGNFVIQTLEGMMYVSPGDFIIIGVEGEVYPCKPNIFKATYDF